LETRQKLQYFLTLQLLLDQRRAAKSRMETPPEELQAHRARFAEKEKLLQGKRVELEKRKAEQATLQQEVEALQRERDHFRRQKTMVTNMRQLQAVVSELDHVESEIKTREEKLLSLWQQAETLEKEIAELASESEEERKLREELEAAFAVQREQAQKELTILEARVREVQKLLGSEGWEEFKKLWASRKPTVVVPMADGSCTHCHAQLRPYLVQVVREMEEFAFCDSCRRLLYDPELVQPLAS